MAGLFVSSSGAGHVINSSPWSKLVPQLPLYAILHFKDIPEPTSAPAAYPGCIPAPSQRDRGLESVSASLQPRVACPGVGLPEQRNLSHHIQRLYPALIPSQDQRRQPEAAGGQRTSAHRTLTLPSTIPLCHRNRDLWNPLFSLLHSSQEEQIPSLASLPRSELLLGFLFFSLENPIWTWRD